ncbi:hypothetical protein E2C04_11035 [Nocardioides daphniae]|uniref:Polyprenyl synthetase family protein n=1 Tax=Nocardioides daphniae TaxID=402297 RepID=A0A4P7UBM3_9ACTN|nr:hypothetical protein E2C04_11035 [Nocardioides daphniae]
MNCAPRSPPPRGPSAPGCASRPNSWTTVPGTSSGTTHERRPRSCTMTLQAQIDTLVSPTPGLGGLSLDRSMLGIALRMGTEGGKRFRPWLFATTYQQLNGRYDDAPAVDHKTLERIAAAIELLHTAFVIHDDVIDNDDERRGNSSIPGWFRGSTTSGSTSTPGPAPSSPATSPWLPRSAASPPAAPPPRPPPRCSTCSTPRCTTPRSASSPTYASPSAAPPRPWTTPSRSPSSRRLRTPSSSR